MRTTPTVAERRSTCASHQRCSEEWPFLGYPWVPQAPSESRSQGVAPLYWQDCRGCVIVVGICIGEDLNIAVDERRTCSYLVFVLSTACQCRALSIIPIAVIASVP
jgi:hypothetical protein